MEYSPFNSTYSESRALIIGINEYQNVQNLEYALNDAKAMNEILVSEFEFKKENIKCLMDAEATRENILKEYHRFTQPDINVDDKIFVFFAGHGHTINGYRGDTGFLIPYDADVNETSSLIAWKELLLVTDMIRAKHIFFVFDACFSGLALSRSANSGRARFLKNMKMRLSRQVLTAGKANEPVADSGGPLPNHSVFTGHLLEGMMGKAKTKNGILTAVGLMNYVYEHVTHDKNSNQTPHSGFIDGDGDFVFISDDCFEDNINDRINNDLLVEFPPVSPFRETTSLEERVKKLKRLLSDNKERIFLHDFLQIETKSFISATILELNKSINNNVDSNALSAKIDAYNEFSLDFGTIVSCVASWPPEEHKSIIQNLFGRLTENYTNLNQNYNFPELKEYPLIAITYMAGIAALNSKRYDVLANIFFSKMGDNRAGYEVENLVGFINQEYLRFNQNTLFKRLPDYKNYHTPVSEFLYNTIQAKLDDMFYLGKRFEKLFDEFEILAALVEINQDRWGVMGRYTWKHSQLHHNSVLNEVIKEASIKRENWEPFKVGLFGDDFESFIAKAKSYETRITEMGWR